MTRQQKYPDTDTFKFYNANPKGRMTGDCLIRAISTATEIPYNEVVMELAELWCKTGESQPYEKYLEMNGWVKHKQPKKKNGKKYTGREFCKMINENCIAKIGCHHIVAIIDNKVHDIWDSTDRCIGNYWTKG